MSSVQGMDALMHRMKALGETHVQMRGLQLATIAEAHRLVPRRTGLLQRRIVPGPVSDTSAVIEAKTPYAATVEYGSRPHIIRPKNRKVLAWGGERRLSGRLRKGSSATNFATIVHHPGTKPHPYLIPGAQRAISKYGLDGIVKVWNEAG